MEERYRRLYENIHAPERLKASVENAAGQPKEKGRRFAVRSALAAAAVAVALVGTVFAAEVVGGFDFVQFFSGGEKAALVDGEELDILYEVDDGGMVYFPVEDLTQELRDAAGASGGGLTMLDKGTWSGAAEFVGLEIPLSSVLEKRAEHVGVTIAIGGGPERNYGCGVQLNGTEPKGVMIEDAYRIGGVQINVTASIKTDAIESEQRGGPIYCYVVEGERTARSREDYLTPEGLTAVIVCGQTLYNSSSVQAIFTLNGINYRLLISSYDMEHAVDIMKTVLDGFPGPA